MNEARLDLSAGIDASGRDPIVRMMIARSWVARSAFLAASVGLATLPIVASLVKGSFSNSSLQLDVSRDVGYFNSFFVLLPFFVWFNWYYLSAFGPALGALVDDQVVHMPGDERATFTGQANQVFRRWDLTFFPYAVAATALLIATTFMWSARKNAYNSLPSGQWSIEAVLTVPPVILLYHSIGALVVRMVAISHLVKLFLREDRVQSHALHPDGCGGFRPLGRFALRVGLAGLVTGVALLIGVWANINRWHFELSDFPNVVMSVGYLVGLTVGFFLPLYPARQAMLHAKETTIGKISRRIKDQLDRSIEALDERPDVAKQRLESIENLQKLHGIANSMPVFPFNAGTLVRFASSVLWPVIPVLVDKLL